MKTSLTLSESDVEAKRIVVNSTVPIVCQYGSVSCRLVVDFHQSDTRDSFLLNSCDLSFLPKPKEQYQAQEMGISSKVDLIRDGDKSVDLTLRIRSIDESLLDWKCHKELPKIKVYIYIAIFNCFDKVYFK